MTEGERIIKLETQMTGIEKKVDDMSAMTEKRFDSIDKMMGDFIEKSENKFASKWVETVMWSSGAVIGSALLIAGLTLILK